MNRICVDDGVLLTFSDDTCCLNGDYYSDVPLLITVDGKPIEAPSAWFRHLAKNGRRRTGLRQTALNLTVFWRWLRSEGSIQFGGAQRALGDDVWKHMSDEMLLFYRAACKRIGNEDATVNAKISVVLRFYWWAQENDFIADRIGHGKREDGSRYPIQIARFQVRGRWRITSDLLFATHTPSMLPVPTNEEINDAFIRLAEDKNQGTRVRSVLMFNWVLSTGIRRGELLSLRETDLPSDSACPREDDRWPITVTGKGGKQRTVFPATELIEETRAYLRDERNQVSRTTGLLRGPEEIFVSHSSGESLSSRQVSRIFKDAFVDAATKLHTHRVRAKFATDFLNENVDAEVERVGIYNIEKELLIDALAEVLGHSDRRTLRRYVDVRLRWHALGLNKL